MYRRFFKRPLDLAASAVAIIVLSPVLAVVWVWLTIANKGAGAVFTQKRPGRGGRLFKVYKFKTMNDRRDADGRLLPDVQRLTPIGRKVRALSIDELPQLFNVLRGDMSLIGPRPLLPQYLPLYSPQQARRHEVRPGITGWAQCHGRNAISWHEKFSLDVWYVDHLTFATDCRVIAATLLSVIRHSDISAGEKCTMALFDGHN